MILPVTINDVISIIEYFNKIKIFGNKPCGRSSDMNRNTGIMDMFDFEHVKRTKSSEHLNLSQDFQTI